MNTPEITLDSSALTEAIQGNIAEHARKLGISRQHLSNILKGNKNPSADLLLKIQSVFGLSAETISKKNN